MATLDVYKCRLKIYVARNLQKYRGILKKSVFLKNPTRTGYSIIHSLKNKQKLAKTCNLDKWGAKKHNKTLLVQEILIYNS